MDALEGALFNRLDMENSRVFEVPTDLISICVGVDPNLTGEDDEMGVIVAGRARDNHLYILADRSSPLVGRDAALHCWRVVAEYGADILLYESNLGKVWMEQVLRDAYKELQVEGLFPAGTSAPLKAVDSKHGKRTRAEPVAMRLEQQRLHMVGRHKELEDQCAEFIPDSGGDSPDRMDAMVHVCRHFMQAEKKTMRMASPVDLDSLRIPEDWRERYTV
jgi:phage terminase large subunit-like protein